MRTTCSSASTLGCTLWRDDRGRVVNFSDHGEQLAAIRRSVLGVLNRLPVYLALPPDKQRQIANDTVKVLDFITAGPDGKTRPERIQFAEKSKRTKGNGHVINVFSALNGTVDFPGFVGALINGVFQSVVASTIAQMEAYAALVKAVSETVDQFVEDDRKILEPDWAARRRFRLTQQQNVAGVFMNGVNRVTFGQGSAQPD